jgi:hypothetical protein
MKIIPYKMAVDPREARIAALWLMYLRAPAHDNPDVDGMYSLGEIGQTKSDRGVDRWCPYSIGRIRA